MLFQFYFFNNDENFADDNNRVTLGNTFKFFVGKGLPQGTVNDYFEASINVQRIVIDLGYFVSILLILNILKGTSFKIVLILLRFQTSSNCIDSVNHCFRYYDRHLRGIA